MAQTTGTNVSPEAIAAAIAEITGFRGQIVFDESLPDGTPQKLSDITQLHELGWSARIPLRQGLAQTIAWFREHARGASESRLPEPTISP